MMEMHLFSKARQVKLPNVNEKSGLKEIFTLLCEISAWSQTEPILFDSNEENTVYFIIHDVAFSEYDFWQYFGEQIIQLNDRYKIDFFSNAADSQETVLLTLDNVDGKYYGSEMTISGKAYEVLQAFCVKISCKCDNESKIIYDVFKSANWKTGILVCDMKYRSFFEGVNDFQNSSYLYISVMGYETNDDYINSLDFNKKIDLWYNFLKENLEYIEFQWLYNAICRDLIENRIEWELSLHTAMKNIGYTIKTSKNGFEIYDEIDNRCYFSFDSHRFSVKAFLKILFPINV